MIANRIKMLRKENQWNQAELAKKIGVGRTSVTAYETGQVVPTLEKLQELSKVFHVSIQYLTGQSNSRNEVIDDVDDLAENIQHLIDQLNTKECSMKFNGSLMSVDQKHLAAEQLKALFTLLNYVNNM